MRRSETDKRVIHNDEVVAIQILLDGSLTKLPQSSPVPVDLYFGILFFIFGNSSEQRGIATRMIPGEPFKSNSHNSLLAFGNVLRQVKRPAASQPVKYARNTAPLHPAGSTPHKLPQCDPILCAWGPPAFP